MSGKNRDRVLEQREALIEEVAASCDYLEQTIDNLNLAVTEKTQSDLARMRAELDETIRVARKAEERTESLTENVKSYDTAEFE